MPRDPQHTRPPCCLSRTPSSRTRSHNPLPPLSLCTAVTVEERPSFLRRAVDRDGPARRSSRWAGHSADELLLPPLIHARRSAVSRTFLLWDGLAPAQPEAA